MARGDVGTDHARPACDRRVDTTEYDRRMDMLSLSAHLPEVDVDAGDVLVREGGAAGAIWVLVEGSLCVRN